MKNRLINKIKFMKNSKFIKNRAIVIASMTAISLGILFGYNAIREDDVVEVKDDYIPVDVEQVMSQSLSEKINFSGEIIPSSIVSVVPKVPGKVTGVNVEVGAVVSQGSVLFTIDNTDMQAQVNQAKSSVDAAKANYDKFKKQLEKASTNSPELDLLKIQVEQAELSYSQAQSALNDANITSPISGIVSEVNINQGGMASNAQPSIVIVDLSKMYVQVDVPENMIGKLVVGDKTLTKIPSVEFSSEGVVELISPVPDTRTQMYFLKVLITDIPETVKPGMFAKVILDVNPKEGVAAVLSDAILEDGTKKYVFVEQDELAEKREVVIGIDSGEYTEILSGVNIGETVLIKGQNYVKDGSKVKVVRGES